MYYELPEEKKECSKCGSLLWEEFKRSYCKGIRCLSCNHEVLGNLNKLEEISQIPKIGGYVHDCKAGPTIKKF